MKLRNDRIIIFGGGRGIGKAIAKRFCNEEGVKIIIAGRNEDKLRNAANEIGSSNLYYKAFDIANVEEHMDFLDDCSKIIGKPSGFVNAAALGTSAYTGRGYEPWDITGEEWDALNDINYKGAFFLMRNEIDYMLKNNIRGNILNFASNAACMPIVGSYGASKQAIIKWTRSFGNRYGHNGIIINGIAPGATLTPMISHYAKDINEKYERHAIERFIHPCEIAELAYYLMSNYGEIICGHTVVADGGDNNASL